MKTLKLILTAILLMIAYVANAQTIQLYKDGAVVKEYSSAEVDSVVYKPAAAAPRYYYYAGWDCPNSVEELEEFATKTSKEGNGTLFVAGYVSHLDGWGGHNPIITTSDTSKVPSGTKSQWYVCLPQSLKIYVDVFGTIIDDMDAYTTVKSFAHNGTTYTVYLSNSKSFYLNDIIIG